MNAIKNKDFISAKQKALHLYLHKNYSFEEIAEAIGKSKRTVYRFLNASEPEKKSRRQSSDTQIKRKSKYPESLKNKIIALKKENPRRSATMIQKILQKSETQDIPSESTIRRYLVNAGLGRVASESRQGYVMFEQKHPNELWQIDIAGVQTVGHLGQLYLFALLDDCSRFVPAAFYADNQRGINVFNLLQKAITAFGRPQAILADNGKQFRNIITSIDSKYEKLLKLMDIKPIYARVRHPQTKGKLERFFGSVKTMFLSEARYEVLSHPDWTLLDFNRKFQDWLEYYNKKHRHRSVPQRQSPFTIYMKNSRIFRPLKVTPDWRIWKVQRNTRKVSKTNQISFQGMRYPIPPGFAGLRVELRIFGTKLEVYRKSQCIAVIHS